MRRTLIFGLIFLSACGDKAEGGPGPDAGVIDRGVTDGGDDDQGRPDAGPRDAEVRPDADVYPDASFFDGAVGCQPASSYVGDPAWPMTLTTGPNAMLCQYPTAYWADVRDVLDDKGRLQLVEGEYKLPVDAHAAPLFIPACFEGLAPPPAIGVGAVDAMRVTDFESPFEQYRIHARFPLSDGTQLQMTLRRDLDAPDLRLDMPIGDYWALQAKQCEEQSCFGANDKLFLPCEMTPRVCDRFVFDDGQLDIQQFHWAGQVGAGFASPQRVRGTFRNQPVDINAYEKMTMTYGQHAFSRSLIVFFDAPIDGVCGLYFAEVSEYGQVMPVELIDCDANAIGTSAVTSHAHYYGEVCP